MPLKEAAIDCRVLREADPAAVELLYREAGWWEAGFTPDFIPPLVRGSFRFVGAFNAVGAMIGMGRAISDGCSDAYIQDIVVARAYRRSGIGRRIVALLVAELHAAGVDWIGLIGAPGTEKFYSRLGFAPMPDYIPMLHQSAGPEPRRTRPLNRAENKKTPA
ncbi:MAG: GNAT family N-acetyltransferase [Victivallales bacterium]|nr:GNAT family N-acetyltransferase [Victivallales bacterium]